MAWAGSSALKILWKVIMRCEHEQLGAHIHHLDPVCRTKQEVTSIYSFRPSCSLKSNKVQSWSEVLVHRKFQDFPPKNLGVAPVQGALCELDCY